MDAEKESNMQKAGSMNSGKEIHISMTGREHNTWQGIIVEGEQTIPFSSELELLLLMEELLEQSNKSTEEEGRAVHVED